MEYASRMKRLADTLRDVGTPVPERALIANLFRGLNNKFQHAVGDLTSKPPEPTFLKARSYLMQEESRIAHVAKMEATTSLLAAASVSNSSSSTSASATSSSSAPATNTALTASSTSSPTKNNNKKRRRNGDKKNSNTAPRAPTAQPTAVINPWTGVVQAWSLPQWRAQGGGLLGPRPGVAPPHQAMHESGVPFGYNNHTGPAATTPPGLYTALQSATTTPYTGNGEWFLDTGATSHMANNPGSSNADGALPM